jgi:hypothetical protein
MIDKRILIVCEDKRSFTALAREFSCYLHISTSFMDHATTADEAEILIRGKEYAVAVIVSEDESKRDRLCFEALAHRQGVNTCFVDLRANYRADASLYAIPATVWLGPESRTDHVRKAIRRFLVEPKSKERGGWR